MPKFLNINVIIVFFVLTLFSIGFSAPETLTVTTYYPSPWGSYQELRVQQMSVGSAYDSIALANGYLIVESRVGIGVVSPTVALDIVGNALITGNLTVTGTITGPLGAYINPDYVFAPGYNLRSLEELKDFIKENKHLPNMPSTEEINRNGVEIFEQNRLMLEKLEEAYLYIIELENRVAKLEAKMGSESNDRQVK